MKLWLHPVAQFTVKKKKKIANTHDNKIISEYLRHTGGLNRVLGSVHVCELE